ncbi:MAG: hypothetical protein ACP5D2_02505 [Candidatus Nanoarchaeia archaeon]
MEFKKERKMRSGVIIFIVLIVIMTSSILVAGNSTIINDTVENIVEVVSKIEVWANTFIDIEPKENATVVLLYLDNGTSLPNQKIEFYLDESLIDSQLTDSEGYAKLIFNPNVIPGTYFFKAEFKGNPSLYLNPSFAEEQIEIIRLNETNTNITILNETNQSLLTIYTDKNYYVQNETINIFGEIIINGQRVDKEIKLEIEFNSSKIFTANISSTEGNYIYSLIADFEEEGDYLIKIFIENLSAETNFYFLKNYSINLEGMICKEFTDNVLFSSGYTHNKKGSTNYETWKIQTNCTAAGGQDCLLYNVNTKSRILYVNPYDEEITGEGYVQISELDSDCNPEKEKYSKYLARDTPKEDGGKWERYCEKTKTLDSKCELENSENYYKASTCYGIKTYASQYSIVDVVEIKYTWCWDDSYGDNSKKIEIENE